MKFQSLILFTLIAVASLWGQANPVPSPQATQPSTPSSAKNGDLSPVDVPATRLQQNPKLAAEAQEIKEKLDEMKTQAAKAKDPAVKKYLELETELWSLSLSRLPKLLWPCFGFSSDLARILVRRHKRIAGR